MQARRAAPPPSGRAPPAPRPTPPGSGGRGRRACRPSRRWRPHVRKKNAAGARIVTPRRHPGAASSLAPQLPGSLAPQLPSSLPSRHRRAPAAPIRRPHGRILDAQLVEVGLVLLRVVVERPHLLAVLLHCRLVHVDRRPVLGPDDRLASWVLGAR